MTDSDSSHDRAAGIEFGELTEDLESHEYPTTSEQLVAEYGDRRLGLPHGETTLAETLADFEENDRFESAWEVQQAILTMVESDAVGRENYTDRGIGRTPDEDVESI